MFSHYTNVRYSEPLIVKKSSSEIIRRIIIEKMNSPTITVLNYSMWRDLLILVSLVVGLLISFSIFRVYILKGLKPKCK